jgi:hypothetical protein
MRRSCVLPLFLLAAIASADGPADNVPNQVRPIPPVGNAIPDADRAELKMGLAELQQLVKGVGEHNLLPDVLVYEKAVRWALDYNEIFDSKGSKPAANVKKVLKDGLDRAKQLQVGKTPWATQTGGVLRGYRSKIDGSVQPYWLIIPKDYDFAGKTNHRVDFWWHGRGETLSEANFMANAPGASGIIPAPGAIILHPYGRFCNANKFAGEIDTLECLDHAKKHYRIDESRLVARGFSMGGAACWQFAVHYPGRWCAAAPGAGFAETKEFLAAFQNEQVQPTWYEKRLYRMYDATEYAQNFNYLPVVAYSGENDKQKQAADVMAKAMAGWKLELKHVIGAKAGHNYTDEAKREINETIDAIVAKGKPPAGQKFEFVTYTLRYPECSLVRVERMSRHWEKALVRAWIAEGGEVFGVQAYDIAMLSLPLGEKLPRKVTINGSLIEVPKDYKHSRVYLTLSDPGNTPFFRLATDEEIRAPGKKPGLQGPIDDAFLESFVIVKPTGKPMNDALGKWSEAEMTRAVREWRRQFRGDAVVKEDTAIAEADIANSNLILWGDPKSNAVLAKIADKLPLKEFTDTTTTLLVYPNPLNPTKYVVLNSGFTFREYDYLNNARQVPKLPDYAVVDVRTPPNSRFPGKVVRAGFFDELWKLRADDGKGKE